jgi:sigma-B regulation protein RsbU (phosphoserine phosphatase)
MKVLIAEDDPVSRRVLEAALAKLGYSVATYCDGAAALEALQQTDAPKLAILDWLMPFPDGVEICRRLRARGTSEPTYVILLTGKTDKASLVAGLDSGADDYLIKPFDQEELRARLQAGRRVIELQMALARRVRALEVSLAQVRQLQGLLPICSYCKKIRDDQNYWQQVESYVAARSDAQFSHGICPECYEKEVIPQLRAAFPNGSSQ